MSTSETTTRTLRTTGNLTVLDIKTFLIGLPDEAKIRVHENRPDRPGVDASETVIAATFSEPTR